MPKKRIILYISILVIAVMVCFAARQVLAVEIINMGGGIIRNLAPGTTSTDAATYGQVLGVAVGAGSANQTLRHNGSSWEASGVLTNDGTNNVGVGGNLTVDTDIYMGGYRNYLSGGWYYLGMSGTNYSRGIAASAVYAYNTLYAHGQDTDARYLGISAKAADSNLLDNIDSTGFVRTTYNTSLNSDSRNSRGPTRLYRRDSDSDYSVQTYWTGSYWRLYGYFGDTDHADTQVGYANDADKLDGQHASAFLTTGTSFNGDVTGTYNATVVGNDSHTHKYIKPFKEYGSYIADSDLPSALLGTDLGGGGLRTDFMNACGGTGGWATTLTLDGYNYYGATQLAFPYSVGGDYPNMYIRYSNYTGNSWGAWQKMWHAGNDGSGSGLDADLLDGQHYSATWAADPSATNEIQILGTSGNTITLSNGGGSVTAPYALNADKLDNIDSPSFLRSDANDTYTGVLTINGDLQRGGHSKGYFIGSYNNIGANSAMSNPIYVIGSSYKPTDTTLENMYGIGYAHGDFWGTADGRPGGWGQYVAADGDIRIVLDASSGIVWSSASTRSPIFYDSNNTGYYVDPNSNSWLYRIYSYDVRSDIYYDRNDTGYYVDPASTSKFNTVNLGGVSRSTWPAEGIAACSDCDGSFVNVTGDTMIGKLTASGNIDTPGIKLTGNYSAGWGGWNYVMQIDNASHGMIHNSAGGIGFGLHSNTNFYWANTTAGTYPMTLSNTGNLTALGTGTFANVNTGPGVTEVHLMNQNVQNTDSPTFGSVYTSNWFRSTGATGWFSETYGGGWYMTDVTWLRAYNNKYVRAAYFYSDGLGAYATVGSGTAGYLTRWTGTYTQGNSVIYDNGTKVGIGMTDPGQKLTVFGTIESIGEAGGFKFPDGTVQKSAALGTKFRRVYTGYVDEYLVSVPYFDIKTYGTGHKLRIVNKIGGNIYYYYAVDNNPLTTGTIAGGGYADINVLGTKVEIVVTDTANVYVDFVGINRTGAVFGIVTIYP